MMKKILQITTSVQGDRSLSNQLSQAITDRILKDEPDSQVVVRDLAKHPFPHLAEAHYLSFYTPEDIRTDANREALVHSDEAIQEIRNADIIVIGVPVYNFNMPSTLKSWIDHITRKDVTFNYMDHKPVGYLTGKKVYLAIASGAVYSDGPMKAFDFLEPYLRFSLGFIGMTDITVFRVEGMLIDGVKENAVPKALKAVESFAF